MRVFEEIATMLLVMKRARLDAMRKLFDDLRIERKQKKNCIKQWDDFRSVTINEIDYFRVDFLWRKMWPERHFTIEFLLNVRIRWKWNDILFSVKWAEIQFVWDLSSKIDCLDMFRHVWIMNMICISNYSIHFDLLPAYLK